MIDSGGEELQKLLGQMQKFNANISGSGAYFSKRRKELEALMEQEGACAACFTLWAADDHWSRLRKNHSWRQRDASNCY